MKKQLVCVNCPKGCRITVTFEQERITDIIGYSCEQGKNYAAQESVDPMRILTSTVRIHYGCFRLLRKRKFRYDYGKKPWQRYGKSV